MKKQDGRGGGVRLCFREPNIRGCRPADHNPSYQPYHKKERLNFNFTMVRDTMPRERSLKKRAGARTGALSGGIGARRRYFKSGLVNARRESYN